MFYFAFAYAVFPAVGKEPGGESTERSIKMKTRITSILAILLALALCVGLSACAKGGTEEAEDLMFGFDLIDDFEEVEELDANPDQDIHRATDPIRQNVMTRLDGQPVRSDAYLYRELLSDTYKQAYDLIRNGIAEGKKDIELTVPVDKGDIKQVYRSVYYDSPDLFWMEGGYSYSYNNYGNVTKIQPKYNALASDIPGNRAAFENALKDALADMWSLGDAKAQVKYAHDYLTSTIDYDYNAVYNQCAYSAVVNHRSVCAGYSRAFQYMMQKMDVRCAFIAGTCTTSQGSGGHAWNIVELGSEFYAMDVTWDDPIGASAGKYYYNYFNVTDSALAKDHARGDVSAKLPAAVGTALTFSSAYSGQYGTDFDAIQGALPAGYGEAATVLIGGQQTDDITDNPYLP